MEKTAHAEIRIIQGRAQRRHFPCVSISHGGQGNREILCFQDDREKRDYADDKIELLFGAKNEL